jgi:hypothetical protein
MSQQYTLKTIRDVLNLPSVTFPFRRELPTYGGIYFVVVPVMTRLCYVGQAQNLRDRWKGHHRAHQMAPDYQIHWLICEGAEERNRLEDTCIRTYRPPWNNALAEACLRDLTFEFTNARMEIASLRFDLDDLYRRWWPIVNELCELRATVRELQAKLQAYDAAVD